ncbi:hypothetical protein Pmani_000632 [Petrolisthes manimaculis]|uniref:Uncharacterized protein n=1 Tax=Petrolisthes manimaculis TaxID=1843537 RepID=A0AAE1QLL2_9EUCA|nr:hypothetical protein Pmani_000632 [Petrolisthes manimaculis]
MDIWHVNGENNAMADALPRSTLPIYTGPHPVLTRTDATVTLNIEGRPYITSWERVKLAHMPTTLNATPNNTLHQPSHSMQAPQRSPLLPTPTQHSHHTATPATHAHHPLHLYSHAPLSHTAPSATLSHTYTTHQHSPPDTHGTQEYHPPLSTIPTCDIQTHIVLPMPYA